MTIRHKILPGLLFAVGCVAAAAGLRALLSEMIGSTRFLPFFPAVMVATLVAGTLSGMVATFLSVLVLIVWFKSGGDTTSPAATAMSISLFTINGLLTVWLCQRARRGRAEVTAADEARLRLGAIVESSDDSIVSEGLDGVIQSWNAAAMRLFGYDAAEIVGRSVGRLVPPDLLAEQAEAVERVKRGERVDPFETIRLHKSGVPVRVLVTMSPLRSAGGRVIGAVEIARDAGQRVRAEADLRLAKSGAERNAAQLRAVIDSMSEGVVIADPFGNLVDWNRSALTSHGFTSADEVRMPLTDAVRLFELLKDGRALPVDEWPMARVLRGESFTAIELDVRRLDTALELIISYSGRPVLDAQGRLQIAVLTLHDVTEERRAQQSLRDTAERLGLALDAAGLGDFAWNARTDIVELSAKAAEIFGANAGAPVTREKMRESIHPADRDRTRRAAEAAAASGSDYDMEYRVQRPDGSTVWVNARGRNETGPDGTAVRMFGVLQDVTPRKLAEQALRDSREWLELAVSIAQMGTFRFDLKESSLMLNDAGRAVYGFGGDMPLTFDSVTSRFHPDDADEVVKAVRESLRAEGARRFEIEHRIVRTDGQVRWIRVRGRALFEDAAEFATQCVGTFLDITEHKEAEHQREVLLASEQAARQQAEHAGRMKDEFLATLSHELRTPLNAILGWSQILAEPGMSAEEWTQGLDIITRNARSQAQIIDDLLDMSRIISGKVRLEVGPLNLRSVADTAIDTVRPTAEAKGVRLRADVNARCGHVAGDASRLQQVLWNLLTNAIKFTPKGGEVTLSIRPARLDGTENVEIVVADSGEGIRPDFLPHVFDRFRQADASTTRRHGGLGLGLAIVRQLSELHGGTVAVASRGIGQGSIFTVTLPAASPSEPALTDEAAAAPAAAPVAARRPGPDFAGLRVIVVDDEPDALALVQRLLADRGATVAVAGSADAAMTLLAADRPDLLLSDIGMPGEDGYALLARARHAGYDGLALALTAYARSEDRDKAIAAGFTAHLAKPVEPAKLLATVAELTGRSNGQQG